MLRYRLLVLSLAVPLLVACGGDDGEDIRIGDASSPIMGGYLDETDTMVIGIQEIGGNFGRCSGTLIAPNVVLTAQHCVAETSGGGSVQCGLTQFFPAEPPGELYITTNTFFTMSPSDYRSVREVHIPNGPQFCGNDQAILILTDPIPPEVAIPATPKVDEPVIAGEEYYAVGYGQLYDSDNAPSGTRYRRDALHAECVGAACGFSQITDTEWLGETGVCSGDSGGPAFDLQNRVTGVASRGSPQCETPIYGHVHSWGQWIKDTTIHASALAGTAPPPWATGWPTNPAYNFPIGGACVAPVDCPSGICVEGECSRKCNALAPCPEGYQCDEFEVCVAIPEPVEDPDGDEVASSGCALVVDPTKPIPWKWTLLALAAIGYRRRRCR